MVLEAPSKPRHPNLPEIMATGSYMLHLDDFSGWLEEPIILVWLLLVVFLLGARFSAKFRQRLPKSWFARKRTGRRVE
jgi:hypothetical protein